MTLGWLVYRLDSRGMPLFLGVYESKQKAETDIDVMGDDDWHVVPVPFIGFGITKQDA